MSVQIDGSTGNIIAIKADYSGDVSIGGTLTYEDVTNVDSVGVITARSGVNVTGGSVGVGTDSPVSGVKLHLQDTSACRLQLSTNNTGHTSSDGVRLMIDSSNNFEILQRESANIEFFTSNTERARIDSSGRIGIGTASPTAPLAVMSSSDPEIRFGYNETQDHKITWDGSKVFLEADPDNANGSSALGFKVDGTEAARFDSSGNFGIGESSPTRKLVVTGDTNTVAVVRGATNGTSSLFLGDSDDEDIGALTYNHPSNYLAITVNAAERMRIDSSGNVNIGSNTSSNPFTYLRFGASQYGAADIRPTNDGSHKVGLSFYTDGTQDTTINPTERMRINSSGDIKHTGSTGADETNKRARYVVPSHDTNEEDVVVFQVENESSSNQITFGGGTSLYNAATKIVFRTASAVDTVTGTERMRIDSSGRLLVGKTSHSGDALLVVESNHTSGGIIGEFDNNDSGNFGGLRILGGVLDRECRLQSLYGNSYLTIYTEGTGAATERMRITSTGNVGINYDSPTAKLEVKEDTTSSSTTIFRIKSNWSNSNQTQMLVLSDGDVENRNNAYRAISDAKLKENIVDANSQWEDIKNLRVRKFNFIEGAGDPTKTHIGLVAQEVESISPGLVRGRADEDENGNDLGTVTKSVNYSVLYMKAVKALQEAQTRIETLETQQSDLLTRVAALEG